MVGGGGEVTVNRQRTITIPWPSRSDVPVSEFAKHPYFKFVAHNMIMRKMLLKKASNY